MSQTSTKNALSQSRRQQVGLVPYWASVTYDEVVYVDDQHVIRCRECKAEIKNKAWVKTHLRECFGINV